MSEARQLQHSPGPFAYFTLDGECIILDAERNFIADLMQSPHHADGHLMAAAPDMLRLLRVVQHAETWRVAIEFPEERAKIVEAINEARQLIAKLDGQQP